MLGEVGSLPSDSDGVVVWRFRPQAGVVRVSQRRYNLGFAKLPPLPRFSRSPSKPMRFCLLDRICSYTPGEELKAIKNVSLAEEYLGDHFPEFPVLPGVFMLEAGVQAAAWLLRLTDDYAYSVITLAEARAVKYADFVAPGHALQMTVTLAKRDGARSTFKFQGEVAGQPCVSGRLVVQCANLADDDPELADLDRRMVAKQREVESTLLGRRMEASAT